MSKSYSVKDITGSGLCIGCGSCVAQAIHPTAHMRFDKYGQLKPQGDSAWMNAPNETLTRTCPFSPEAKNEDQLAEALYPATPHIDEALGRFQTAYVGYVAEGDFRMQGSSGGLVTWVATELMRHGLIDGVAHVIPVEDPQTEQRYFRYTLSTTEGAIRGGAKSRYYPIELSEVLQLVKDRPGRYAVVGIPCFIKAIQLLRTEDAMWRERIPFTLGLFCGHMKSARFIESFAWQMNVPVQEVQQVEFRLKDPSRPANWYNAQLTLANGQQVNRDWWNLADGDWGAGHFMNNACNYCDDVVGETADISFGDAWVEPYSSDGRGTNVVVVRSTVVNDLVSNAIGDGRLTLQHVDSQFVADTQAAGFRQRREGLAYRLSWHKTRIKPRKRVAPDAERPTRRRKLIYRMRYLISAGSHQVFSVARRLNKPQLYIRWARTAEKVYHGLAYHRGKIGAWVKKLGLD